MTWKKSCKNLALSKVIIRTKFDISSDTKPSLYDCIALAVAKTRGITLLTGDGPLRKAAAAEGVEVMGTIGILDRLYDGNYIDEEEFPHCIGELMEHNGSKIRLPVAELKKRMK